MKVYKIGLLKKLFVWLVLPIAAVVCIFVGLLFAEELNAAKENSQSLSEMLSGFRKNEVEFRKSLDSSEETSDFDGDGLDNSSELLLGTSVYLKDSDGDGLTDKFEYDYIISSMENGTIGKLSLFLLSKSKGYVSLYSKLVVKPKNVSYELLYNKDWAETFYDSTGLKINEDYIDYFDKEVKFESYSGKVFENVELIGKPFVCDGYSGYVEFILPKKLLKSADEYDEIYFYQYDIDADVYSYSAKFTINDYDENEDFELGVDVDDSDRIVNCFCYNSFGENGYPRSPYNYESFKFTTFMNTQSSKTDYVILNSTNGQRVLLFSASFINNEETELFENLVSRDFDCILKIKESWLKRIKRIFIDKVDGVQTEENLLTDLSFETIVDQIESELRVNFEASAVNNVGYQDFIKTYCENTLEYVNGVSLETKTKMYIDIANVDFAPDDETLAYIERAKNMNHLYGLSDIISNRVNYNSDPYCDYDAIMPSNYITPADYLPTDVDNGTASNGYVDYILEKQTLINSTRYVGESKKKYDNYSDVNKVLDSLKNNKVAVAYLAGKCGTTSVVIYGASYSSIDPNIIKLKVFDPLLYNLRVSEKDGSDKSVKLGYSELTVYKDELVIYSQNDSGEFVRYPYVAFNFEYGDMFRYHFGNTKRVSGLLSYSKSQIFFRDQNDLSKKNDGFINVS